MIDWIKKQTGKISDNFNNYNFYITHEPEIIDSSSVVSVNTYTSRDMTATVPCSYRWCTIRNGITTEISQFRGNTYICQPSDVGCYLQAEITSSDPQHNGTAIIRLGPVKFDVLLKKQLQIALSASQSTFYVDLIEKNIIKQCQLRISQQKIYISHLSSQTSYIFSYSMVEPKVQVLHKIPTKIHIIFNPKYYDQLRKFLIRLFGQEVFTQEFLRNPFLEVNFSNRKCKDSFVFITKAFNTKKLLKTSSYVINLQKQIDFTLQKQNISKNFDYLQQICSLQYDISKLLEINTKNYKQKRLYLEENKKLQKQIQEIVGTYLRIIQQKFSGRQDFQKSFIVLKEKEEKINNNKLNSNNNREDNQFSSNRQIQQKNMRIFDLTKENAQLKEIIKRFQNESMINNNKKLDYSRMSENIMQQQQKYSSPGMTFSKKQTPYVIGSSSNVEQNSGNNNNQVLSNNNQSLQQPQQNEQLKRLNEQLLKQKYQISMKFQSLKKQFQALQKQVKTYRSLQLQTNNKSMGQDNLDLFDAKSVKSMRQQNNNGNNNLSSMLLSKDSLLFSDQKRLKFSQTDYKKLAVSTDQQVVIQKLVEENNQLKMQVLGLQEELSKKVSEYQEKESKYKKKIGEINEELEMYRRSNDALNRSQHLSMQMEQYNQQQQKVLSKQNSYLLQQNQKLRQMCKKYMYDAKKYKQLKKSSTTNQQNDIV